MNDLSDQLRACKTGCMMGGRLVNHLMYTDDLVTPSFYSAGLQQLLRICSSYGVHFDIGYDVKCVIMIVGAKDDQSQQFPSSLISSQVFSGGTSQISGAHYQK